MSVPNLELPKVRTRAQSIRIALIGALCVAIFVSLIFVAVYTIVHENNAQSAKQRAFAREITCQVIKADQKTNGDILYNFAIKNHATASQAEAIKRSYDRSLSTNIEDQLGLVGKKLINSDGTLNCTVYMELGDHVPPPPPMHH